ncbi:MAG TPA: hypothetical protein VE987_05860 [Polyangiaceae bacterium]|nr:hypothetical protein [Polyangiaceae bacterium]
MSFPRRSAERSSAGNGSIGNLRQVAVLLFVSGAAPLCVAVGCSGDAPATNLEGGAKECGCEGPDSVIDATVNTTTSGADAGMGDGGDRGDSRVPAEGAVDEAPDGSPTGHDVLDAADELDAGPGRAPDAVSDAATQDGWLPGDAAGGCDSLTPTECLIEVEAGVDCLRCAQLQCADAGLWCEHLAGQTADAGPASGQARQDLCVATLGCIFVSQCYFAANGLEGCYCGSESLVACREAGPAPAADQLCLTPEQNGLETTVPSTALDRFDDTSLGAGTANALFQCLSACAACP